MKATALLNLLKTTIPAHEPVLIKGQPGGGKTDVVTQAAAACSASLLISHPVVSDPTDFKGMPAIVTHKNGKQTAEFLPFGDLRNWLEAQALTVVFLDDIGQAPQVVQASCMHPILARCVCQHKISEHVTFVAATNRREDRAAVTGILEPVKSRFSTIVQLDVDVNDWCQWALGHDVPAELIAFVRFRPTLLTNAGPITNDIVNRPSPRTVASMGRLHKLGITDLEVLAGAVGEGFASEFTGFLRVWRSLPSIDAIMLDPQAAKVPSEPAALYAIATALASRSTPTNAGRIVKYISRLPKEFGTLAVRDMVRVCPGATGNKEFIKWAGDNQDLLL